MPEYKATLKFESTATVYIDAEDETSARGKLESITEAELREGTLWERLFKTIVNPQVISIERE